MALSFEQRCNACGTRVTEESVWCPSCNSDLTEDGALWRERDVCRAEFERGFFRYVIINGLMVHAAWALAAIALNTWLRGGKVDGIHVAEVLLTALIVSFLVRWVRWREYIQEFAEPADAPSC